MRGGQWRLVTQRVYPAAIALLAIGAGLPLAVFIVQRLPLRPAKPEIEATIVPDTRTVPPSPLVTSSPPLVVVPEPLPTDSSPSVAPDLVPDRTALPPAAVGQGSLRVSNRTDHPIRVALLAQQDLADTSPTSSASAYEEPVHWDFAPQEGSTSGLILSLPEQRLQLQPGDVLVAFAQDGSRRYWGPYVVGETPSPTWQAAVAEWQLILTP